jgi:predicted RNA methylase
MFEAVQRDRCEVRLGPRVVLDATCGSGGMTLARFAVGARASNASSP